MPSGKNRVPMSMLREVLSEYGFQSVSTYIASGNVMLSSPSSAQEVEARVHELIKEEIGPEIVVIAREPEEVKLVLQESPYGGEFDPSRIFYTFFATPPEESKVEQLLALDIDENQLRIGKHAAYMYIPGSAARSNLNNNFLEKKLGVSATTRNGNTLSKLIELCSKSS